MNPFFIAKGSIEVLDINPILQTFSLAVHIRCAPMELHTPYMQEFIAQRVQFAVKYLIDEEFIPDPAKTPAPWQYSISGICHP